MDSKKRKKNPTMNAAPIKQFHDFVKELLTIEYDAVLSDTKIREYKMEFQKYLKQFLPSLQHPLSFRKPDPTIRNTLQNEKMIKIGSVTKKLSDKAVQFISKMSDQLKLNENECYERCFYKKNKINV